MAQVGQPSGVQFAATRQFRCQRSDHSDIVGRLEGGCCNQRLAPHFVQRIFQLRNTIGRVDADQNGPDPRRGKLSQQPFHAVGRPDADPIPGFDTDLQEASRQTVHLMRKLGIAPADILLRKNDSFARAEAGNRSGQQFRNGEFQ